MARLWYRKYQNKNEKLSSMDKWYARLVHVDTLSTDDICRHIQKHGSIYTADVVKGVLEKFIICFEELLLEGHKLKLNGLGTFYLTAETKGEEKEEDFSADNIERLHVKFLPDQSKRSEYSGISMRRKAQFVAWGSEQKKNDEQQPNP